MNGEMIVGRFFKNLVGAVQGRRTLQAAGAAKYSTSVFLLDIPTSNMYHPVYTR